MEIVQVTCSRYVCSKEERNLIETLMKWYWEEMAYEDIEYSSGWNDYILLILSIGTSYYQGGCNTNHRQVSSAQTNQTQMLTWEKTLSTPPALSDLGACSPQSWIALETSFPEIPRSLKTEFGVKSYGVFNELTCAVSRSCDSAANFRSSAAPWQCRTCTRRNG